MAIDSWIPHRFSLLSERLVTQNGVLVMGGSAFGILLYTGGSIDVIVVMYSINVFLDVHPFAARHVRPLVAGAQRGAVVGPTDSPSTASASP